MDIKEARRKLLKDPEFRKEYEKLDLALEISKMIIEARNIKNLTQEELANLVNTHQSSIARLESGNNLPSLSFLQKIGKALNTYLLPPRFAFMTGDNIDEQDRDKVYETIDQALSNQKQEIIEMIKGMGKVRLHEVEAKNLYGAGVEVGKNYGYNQAIQDIIKLLQKEG